jgi:hypothetical protein
VGQRGKAKLLLNNVVLQSGAMMRLRGHRPGSCLLTGNFSSPQLWYRGCRTTMMIKLTVPDEKYLAGYKLCRR